MKKLISLLLCLVFIVTAFAACNKEEDPPEIPSSDIGETPEQPDESDPEDSGSTPDPEQIPDPLPEPVDPIDPDSLTLTKTYKPDSNALLSSYADYDSDVFHGVCQHYYDAGYELYGQSEINNNLFATFTKGGALAHVYWIEKLCELNIVTDIQGANALPPMDEEVTGDIPTSVTQLQQKTSQTSGMSYIVQLSDGSFIIYDGGYADTVNEMMNTLKKLNGDKDEIHIRAWLITHSHDDHYSCFSQFANIYKRYKLNVKLDRLLIAPVNDNEARPLEKADSPYLSEIVHTDIKQFEGAQICYVYTGMVFNICNVNLEILLTPDDLFIDGGITYFNETSIVSRISSADPEGSGETLSMIFLGDAGNEVAKKLMFYYESELRTDMVQISHHGVENFPLLGYQTIRASILFYPCNMDLYSGKTGAGRDEVVRIALKSYPYTKEILLRDNEQYKRYFNPTLNEGLSS